MKRKRHTPEDIIKKLREAGGTYSVEEKRRGSSLKSLA
jgi:hypothetical protein